jgi:hypothetical protein
MPGLAPPCSLSTDTGRACQTMSRLRKYRSFPNAVNNGVS